MPYAYKTRARYSYADYLAWSDNERWELIDGVAYCMTPAPSTEHQRVSMELVYRIRMHLEGRQCQVFSAPFDVRFPVKTFDRDQDIFTVVQPDIAVICDPGKIDERGCNGPPDLIIEVLSPYTADRDMREKFFLYENAGVREYWMADPASRTIHAYRLGGNGKYSPVTVYFQNETISSETLPGMSINLKDIFSSA